jgi:hypothetical protein
VANWKWLLWVQYFLIVGFFCQNALAEYGVTRGLAASKGKASLDLTNVYEKIDAMQTEIDKLQSEVTRLAQSVPNPNPFAHYANSFFFKTGFELLVPRQRSLPTAADTGLGLFIGVGQYFGENHVAEFGAEWDFYPSLSLRYRYELHFNSPGVAVGPEIGYKVKVASVNPWDNFIDDPSQIKNSFFFAGLLLGFPLNGALGTIELLYLVNQQNWFQTNFGVHIFF